MEKIELIATCQLGLESVVTYELHDLGFSDVKTNNGYVDFSGDFNAIAKSNLWLRCADRVFWKIKEFKAIDFDELFDNIKIISWSDLIPEDGEFPVSSVYSKNSKLFSKSDCQSITKKAIVESLKKTYKIERFSESGPKFSIRLQILNDIVSVFLDTTGDSLNKRGYGIKRGDAPIRETLAAAIIKLARWGNDERVLMDPFCGSGTILIEGAMIAKNIAPGKKRNFVSENWPCIPESIWKSNREELPDLENNDAKPKIYGSDIDWRVLDIARKNIELAGFENCIFVQKVPLLDIESKYTRGAMITNPPYGERLSEIEVAEGLYKDMGNVFRERFPEWSYFIITPNTDFQKLFGKRANKNRKLYNGGIKCYLYQYFGQLSRKPKK